VARDTQPTNERIVTMLEAISRQLRELRNEQKQMATDLKRVGRASR
jgi:hypothetical protein